MSSRRKIRPLDGNVSPRFGQPATFARLPHEKTLDDVDVVFVGVPFDDATSYRPGARHGPSSVREFSRGLRPYNIAQRIMPFEVLNVLDYGDIDVVPGHVLDTYERVTAELERIHKKNVIPLVCGGDHSITLASLRAAHNVHGPLTVIDFDAHYDFADAPWGKKYTHATWVRRAIEEGLVKSVTQLGIRGSWHSPADVEWAEKNGVKIYHMNQIEEEGHRKIFREVIEKIDPNEPVYVTVDIDSADPAYAPGTGTVEIGGFSGGQILEFVRMLTNTRLISLDVMEVSPLLDNPTGLTSILAANIFYEAISAIAARRLKQK